MKWIRAEDRLPKKNKFVLVIKESTSKIRSYAISQYLGEKEQQFAHDDLVFKVTHWMR